MKDRFKMPDSLEPLRVNRYILKFTNGIEIEPYRIQEINLGLVHHEFKILEIIKQLNAFKTFKKDMELSYKIDFLDPKGETVETLSYKGIVIHKELSTLTYSKDDVLSTHIQIGNIENVK